MPAKSVKELGEDVELRLAHSAARPLGYAGKGGWHRVG
jgi:hypothetical protein